MNTHFKSKLSSRSGLLAVAFAVVLAGGCGSNDSTTHAAMPADSNARSADEIVPPTNPDGFSGALGNVSKISDTLLELPTPDKPLSIKLTDSLHIFAPMPSSLNHIKGSAYVGVISKKQTDQPDQAVKVLILPEELRGLNEGSFMLPGEKDAEGGSRMTNGSASDAGDGGGSRMSNGSVSGSDGTSLTLQFQGHSRTVKVPG